MLKHNLPETSSPLSAQRTEADTTENSPTVIATVSPDFIEKSISEYLDQVMSSLVGTLHEDEISERRAEMHSHIVAMIDARLELGDSLEIALKETLAQFGQPHKLQVEWTEASENVESFKTSFVKNLKFFGIQILVTQLLFLPIEIHSHLFHTENRIYMYELNTHSLWGCYLLFTVCSLYLIQLSPILFGFLRGYRGFNRQRKMQSWFGSVASIVSAYTVMGIINKVLLYPLYSQFYHSSVHPDAMTTFFYTIISPLIWISIVSVIGVSAGCLKRILKRRRQIAA